MSSPALSDRTTDMLTKISETASNSENPQFRPIEKIIQEGISLYATNTSKNIFYIRSLSYRDNDYYAQEIASIGGSSLFLSSPKTAIEKLEKKFPDEAYQAYASNNNTFSQFESLFASGSGFFTRVKKENSALFDQNGKIIDYDKYFKILQETGKKEINGAKNYIEQKVKDLGEPTSASFILEYFLNKNDGDLSQSIYDTAILLKFMARNDSDTAASSEDQQNIDWMKQNIKDEYQGTNYAKTEEALNPIGKPYHSWSLVAMLKFFPVEMIRTSGIYRQAVTFGSQGLGKTRSDLQTLKDLRGIENLLLSYSVN